MPNFNQVTMIGHLVREPELKYSQSGTAIWKNCLAVNHKYKDQEEVCFIDFTAFAKTAETMDRFFGKGDAVLITGRLQQEKWQDKKTGDNRSKHSIVVMSFAFVGSKKDKDMGNTPVADMEQAADPDPFKEDDMEGIPF